MGATKTNTNSSVTITSDVRRKVLIRIILFSVYTCVGWNMWDTFLTAMFILLMLRVWKWYRTGDHSLVLFLIVECVILSISNTILNVIKSSETAFKTVSTISNIFCWFMVGLIAVMIFCYFYSAKLVKKTKS